MNASPAVTKAEHPGDKQKVELLGRNRLIDELLRDDLEVALPVRDRGIDLIAYVDLESVTPTYVARPIQMKAAWTRSFVVEKKYAKFPGLLLAYVWHLGDRQQAVTYALSYAEALELAGRFPWLKSKSWEVGDKYSTTRPSAELVRLLEPYRMGAGSWRQRILGTPARPDAANLVTTLGAASGAA